QLKDQCPCMAPLASTCSIGHEGAQQESSNCDRPCYLIQGQRDSVFAQAHRIPRRCGDCDRPYPSAVGQWVRARGNGAYSGLSRDRTGNCDARRETVKRGGSQKNSTTKKTFSLQQMTGLVLL